jgi:hypothetical protein
VSSFVFNPLVQFSEDSELGALKAGQTSPNIVVFPFSTVTPFQQMFQPIIITSCNSLSSSLLLKKKDKKERTQVFGQKL